MTVLLEHQNLHLYYNLLRPYDNLSCYCTGERPGVCWHCNQCVRAVWSWHLTVDHCGALAIEISLSRNYFSHVILLYWPILIFTDLSVETDVKSNCPGALGVVLTFGGSPSGSCASINTARARLNKRHLYQHGMSHQSQQLISSVP